VSARGGVGSSAAGSAIQKVRKEGGDEGRGADVFQGTDFFCPSGGQSSPVETCFPRLCAQNFFVCCLLCKPAVKMRLERRGGRA
jgi:hypothetical protein